MSDLRKHLQAEKERHHGFVYPGNLAADILGTAKARPASVMDYADSALRRRPSSWKWLLGFASLAAAAMIAVFVYMHQTPAPIITRQPEAVANNDDEQIPLAPNTTASINDVSGVSIVPSDVDSLVPTYESMTVPSVPNFSDLSTTDTTDTSQEQT